MAYDLRPFVRWIIDEFKPSVRVGSGAGEYARRVGGEFVEVYGAGDMACILYTLDELDPSESERAQWVAQLRAFQDPESGYLIAKTAYLSKVHNTAFTLGAMDLFDAQPAHPLVFSRNFDTPEKMGEYIESRDWANGVYSGGEDVVGLASAFALVPGTVTDDWVTWFMDYFDTNLFDSNNGMVGRGTPPEGTLDQIGGTFHFAFFWEYHGRQMPYGEKRIDSILGLQRPDGDWDPGNPWWMPFDSIYMLTQAAADTGHRVDDVRNCVRGVPALALERVMDEATRRQAFRDRGLGRAYAQRHVGHLRSGAGVFGDRGGHYSKPPQAGHQEAPVYLGVQPPAISFQQLPGAGSRKAALHMVL